MSFWRDPHITVKPDSISIASTNSRRNATYFVSDTLTTTKANQEIKQLAEDLENNMDDELIQMNDITTIKGIKSNIIQNKNKQKYSFESYYSLSDDEWSDSTIKTSSTNSTVKTSHTHISSY